MSGLAGLLGLAVGSFLNVVAYRVPLEKSVVSPPSACPSCGHQIRPRDNIPVLSWFLLRGRCRDCGNPISFRYPLVEASTALLFAATGLVIGLAWVLPAHLVFAASTCVLIITDLDHKRIPNRILYPATAIAGSLLFLGAIGDGRLSDFPRALAGGAGYFALLLLIALIARGGFGMGDVKLAFLLGMFLAFQSWETFWAGIFFAFFIGGGTSIVLLVTRVKGRKDAIPFGPALVLGAWIAVVWGQGLVSWYLS